MESLLEALFQSMKIVASDKSWWFSLITVIESEMEKRDCGFSFVQKKLPRISSHIYHHCLISISTLLSIHRILLRIHGYGWLFLVFVIIIFLQTASETRPFIVWWRSNRRKKVLCSLSHPQIVADHENFHFFLWKIYGWFPFASILETFARIFKDLEQTDTHEQIEQ